MEFSKFLNSSSKLNIILIISFSISVNSFIIFPNFNNVFYILFHLTLIYLIFYHYHYYLYVVALIYGTLFDILLLNNIGAHLITFLSLLILFTCQRAYKYKQINKEIANNWSFQRKENVPIIVLKFLVKS